MQPQYFIIIGTLLAFVVLAFMMSKSIKKHDAKPKLRKKKGRSRYLPEAKGPKK